MIRVCVVPIHGTQTPERGILWQANAEIENRQYAATARMGVVHDLARQLVAAEIPDDGLEVYELGKLAVTYRSFHKAAKRHLSESRTHPIRSVSWRDLSDVNWKAG